MRYIICCIYNVSKLNFLDVIINKGWEPLLSALEACGVDNVCIEVEASMELPAMDGSATKWV